MKLADCDLLSGEDPAFDLKRIEPIRLQRMIVSDRRTLHARHRGNAFEQLLVKVVDLVSAYFEAGNVSSAVNTPSA
jgi:hypothetical protein